MTGAVARTSPSIGARAKGAGDDAAPLANNMRKSELRMKRPPSRDTTTIPYAYAPHAEEPKHVIS
jgi:hypothetical protein